jgi:glyoxylate reductase
MTDARPRLYISRLLPEPVMAAARKQFTLVRQPADAAPSPSELADGLREADAAIVTLTERIDAASIGPASRLKVLANYAVGYNNLDLTALSNRGVVASNTPDVLTDATADLTWALLLAAARRVIEGDRLVRSGKWTGWTPTQLVGAEVAGRTIGIVGLGRIGQAVAERASGFRMSVLYHSRRPVTTDSREHPWRHVLLPELLQQADFVSLHVPFSASTRHLIDAPELGLMKPSAVLINTARGPVVNESALVEALERGKIAGAGLDVYEDEPAVHPGLARHERTVLLPHLGSATWLARVQMGLICLRNVEAVLAGRPAPNRVG